VLCQDSRTRGSMTGIFTLKSDESDTEVLRFCDDQGRM
jgi:hypothetical protein